MKIAPLVALFLPLTFLPAYSQATLAPQKTTCAIDPTPPGDAEKALNANDAAKAELLSTAQLSATPSAEAQAGVVRSLLGEGKTDDALDRATKFLAAVASLPGKDATAIAHNNAVLQDALGAARFRRGEVGEAGQAFNQALKLDGCVARIHSDIARYYRLSGNFLHAQHEVDTAHTLAPEDPSITRDWRQAHARLLSPDQQINRINARAAAPGATDADKKSAAEAVKRVNARNSGSCEMSEPVESIMLPLIALQGPNTEVDKEIKGVGLDIEFNGKRKRLEVDTGASGLLLSKAAASSAGLVPEAEMQMFGFGDQGLTRTMITHVDKLKIGSMEFRNCEVEVVDREGLTTFDGFIGGDVFAQWLVTIDSPSRELRLTPLPKRPGDTTAEAAPTHLESHGSGGNGLDFSSTPHDRYVAPEMADWTKVYRVGHDLIFPVKLNDLPIKLMILDTGAFADILSPETAKELGGIDRTTSEIHGVSGYARMNAVSVPVMVTFGGTKQEIRGMNVVDIATISRSTGVRISGFLGFTSLREFVLSIDYRDNLVKVVYDPKKGFHSRGIDF